MRTLVQVTGTRQPPSGPSLTLTDRALSGGTFCCHHSRPLFEERSPPQSRGIADNEELSHCTVESCPVPPLPEYGGKVRHGLIPEEFFQFLYPKTGVTGPYVLGAGLILYFLSKEIYVVTPETVSAVSTIGLLVYVVKKYGATIGEFADKLNEQKIAPLEDAKQASMKSVQDVAETEKAQQVLVQKRHYLFDVQRNNIAMALGVTYRGRLHRVYSEGKNCLDYLCAEYDALKRTRAHDKQEARGASLPSRKRRQLPSALQTEAAYKEGSGTARAVNVPVPTDSSKHLTDQTEPGLCGRTFLCGRQLEFTHLKLKGLSFTY